MGVTGEYQKNERIYLVFDTDTPGLINPSNPSWPTIEIWDPDNQEVYTSITTFDSERKTYDGSGNGMYIKEFCPEKEGIYTYRFDNNLDPPHDRVCHGYFFVRSDTVYST